MAQEKQRLLFIGAGRMAQAIIGGLLQSSHSEEFEITVTNNNSQERLQSTHRKYGVNIVKHWKEGIEASDVVFLAMPPEEHDQLLSDLSPHINNQFIITIAAGIDISFMENKLPSSTPTAWVMPNTAAQVGKSTTLYSSGQYVNSEQRVTLEKILSSFGSYQQVTQQQIHDLTPITGSAPAFVYKLAHSLVTTAIESGIGEQEARKLVAQMIEGSSLMLQYGESPATLADQVATPGGVTEAGLKILEDNNFDQMMKNAIAACHKRARNR